MLQADGPAGIADKFPPAQGQSGLDRDAGLDGGRQHGLPVSGVLLVEPLDTRHGDDAGGDTFGLEGFTGLDG